MLLSDSSPAPIDPLTIGISPDMMSAYIMIPFDNGLLLGKSLVDQYQNAAREFEQFVVKDSVSSWQSALQAYDRIFDLDFLKGLTQKDPCLVLLFLSPSECSSRSRNEGQVFESISKLWKELEMTHRKLLIIISDSIKDSPNGRQFKDRLVQETRISSALVMLSSNSSLFKTCQSYHSIYYAKNLAMIDQSFQVPSNESLKAAIMDVPRSFIKGFLCIIQKDYNAALQIFNNCHSGIVLAQSSFENEDRRMLFNALPAVSVLALRISSVLWAMRLPRYRKNADDYIAAHVAFCSTIFDGSDHQMTAMCDWKSAVYFCSALLIHHGYKNGPLALFGLDLDHNTISQYFAMKLWSWSGNQLVDNNSFCHDGYYLYLSARMYQAVERANPPAFDMVNSVGGNTDHQQNMNSNSAGDCMITRAVALLSLAHNSYAHRGKMRMCMCILRHLAHQYAASNQTFKAVEQLVMMLQLHHHHHQTSSSWPLIIGDVMRDLSSMDTRKSSHSSNQNQKFQTHQDQGLVNGQVVDQMEDAILDRQIQLQAFWDHAGLFPDLEIDNDFCIRFWHLLEPFSVDPKGTCPVIHIQDPLQTFSCAVRMAMASSVVHEPVFVETLLCNASPVVFVIQRVVVKFLLVVMDNVGNPFSSSSSQNIELASSSTMELECVMDGHQELIPGGVIQLDSTKARIPMLPERCGRLSITSVIVIAAWEDHLNVPVEIVFDSPRALQIYGCAMNFSADQASLVDSQRSCNDELCSWTASSILATRISPLFTAMAWSALVMPVKPMITVNCFIESSLQAPDCLVIQISGTLKYRQDLICKLRGSEVQSHGPRLMIDAEDVRLKYEDDPNEGFEVVDDDDDDDGGGITKHDVDRQRLLVNNSWTMRLSKGSTKPCIMRIPVALRPAVQDSSVIVPWRIECTLAFDRSDYTDDPATISKDPILTTKTFHLRFNPRPVFVKRVTTTCRPCCSFSSSFSSEASNVLNLVEYVVGLEFGCCVEFESAQLISWSLMESDGICNIRSCEDGHAFDLASGRLFEFVVTPNLMQDAAFIRLKFRGEYQLCIEEDSFGGVLEYELDDIPLVRNCIAVFPIWKYPLVSDEYAVVEHTGNLVNSAKAVIAIEALRQFKVCVVEWRIWNLMQQDLADILIKVDPGEDFVFMGKKSVKVELLRRKEPLLLSETKFIPLHLGPVQDVPALICRSSDGVALKVRQFMPDLHVASNQ